MAKENYIKGKVTDIMNVLAGKQQSKRLEANRAAARIANLISQEIDRSTEEYKRHLVKFIHETIRKELS